MIRCLFTGGSMKTCTKCEKEFDESFFYSGRPHCKGCHQEQIRAYRSTPAGREARRRERRKAKENGKDFAWQKSYDLTPKGQATRYRYESKRYRGPEGKARLAAKNAVKYAVRTGKLKRLPCEVCGDSKAVAHHSSYEKDMRLCVTWLCVAHHNELHNQTH